MKKKWLLLIVLLLTLTSCWDLTEIEEIGFVIALAIDTLEEEDYEQYKKQFKKEQNIDPQQLYKTTFQIVIPGTATDELAFEQTPFFNISAVGRTNFKTLRHISTRRSRRLNFEHLKAIIINEEIAQTGAIAKVIDLYIRDHEMRRTTLVFVSKGKGSAVLEEKLPLEMMPGLSIKMIQDNYPASHGMPFPKPIGELATCVVDQKSYIVPRITDKVAPDFVIAGAGVFLGETNELIGWLGEVDMEGYNLIRGEAENAIVEASLEDNLFVVELDNMDSVFTYEQKDGEDHFHIEIKAEGFFTENWLEGIDIGEQEEIEKVEDALEEEIERLASKIVEKMQNEYHADIFELYKTVQRKNYARWKDVEDDWDGEDGYFSNANIEISVKAKIRHYMTKQQLT